MLRSALSRCASTSRITDQALLVRCFSSATPPVAAKTNQYSTGKSHSRGKSRAGELTGVVTSRTAKAYGKSKDSLHRPIRGVQAKAPLERKSRELTANGLPKLRAYDLTDRLVKKCKAGLLDDAIETLRNMPRDAQDTVCWNNMILYTMKAGRYKLAYSLFTEMKRRNFTPNLRTYQVLLHGYTYIDDWQGRTMTAENLSSVYRSFEELVDTIRKSNAVVELAACITPFNNYLTSLRRMGKFDEIWELFNAMPAQGIGAPNVFTYCTVLSAIGDRRAPQRSQRLDRHPGFDPDEPGAQFPTPNAEELHICTNNATDALFVWRMYLRGIERRPELLLDPLPVCKVLQTILRSPMQMHLDFGLEMVLEYFGMPSTGSDIKRGKLKLDLQAMHSILSPLVARKSHDLCLHFGALAMTHPRLSQSIDFGHVEYMLTSRAALAKLPIAQAPGTTAKSQARLALETVDWMLGAAYELSADAERIRPRHSTYKLVLRACWLSNDWASACGAFERMTGLRASTFVDVPPPEAMLPPPAMKRSPGRTLEPDPDCFTNLFRTALSTNVAAQRQALRMLAHYGPAYFSRREERVRPPVTALSSETRAMLRFAAVVVRAGQQVVEHGKAHHGNIFVQLCTTATSYMRTYGRYGPESQRRSDRYSDHQGPLWTRVAEDDFEGAAKLLRETAEDDIVHPI
ncbi:hypothetical protein BKA62DRAFT_505821, partial [Auriculariales sp. MPI-PUGE-AT-0066]